MPALPDLLRLIAAADTETQPASFHLDHLDLRGCRQATWVAPEWYISTLMPTVASPASRYGASASMQVASTKATMNAVAKTGGMSAMAGKAAERPETISVGSIRIVRLYVRPSGGVIISSPFNAPRSYQRCAWGAAPTR